MRSEASPPDRSNLRPTFSFLPRMRAMTAAPQSRARRVARLLACYFHVHILYIEQLSSYSFHYKHPPRHPLLVHYCTTFLWDLGCEMITKEVQITIKLPQRHLRKHLNAPQTPPTPHQTFPKTPSDIFVVVIGTYPKVVFANVQCTLCTTHQPPFAQQYCSQNENLLHQPTCCVNW